MSNSPANKEFQGGNHPNITSIKEDIGARKFREKNNRQFLEERGRKVIKKRSNSTSDNKKDKRSISPLGIIKDVLTISTIPAIGLSMAACQEAPETVEEEVVKEGQQGEIKGDEVIIDSSEIQKETPSVVEKTPEKIEWEGMIITPIEGLRFDKGIFYFLLGNEYGGEVGTKAGVCIPDGPEINGQTAWFGLKKEVLEVMQKKIMEEEKKFIYIFPIDLEQAKRIKIKEVAFTWLDDAYKLDGVFWDNNSYLEISDIPVGTKIHSPVSTTYYLIWDNNLGRNDPSEPSNYTLDFGLFTSGADKEGFLFKNERVDVVDLGIGTAGVSLLPSGVEKNITEKDGGYSFLTETKIGEPIAEVVSEEYRSIKIDCFIYQLKNKNDKVELNKIVVSDISKGLQLGSAGLLKIGDIPVFISQ